jgi:hypothetical protein
MRCTPIGCTPVEYIPEGEARERDNGGRVVRTILVDSVGAGEVSNSEV